MTSSSQPAHRAVSFLRANQLGFLWVVAVLFGVVVISSSPDVTLGRLVVPVLIMVGYAILAFNTAVSLFAGSSAAYRSSIDSQLADSMYFMGFVWTLWALIDSFVIRQINTGDAIFRVFGYALVTTACGMFGRLVILQFKYTGTEQSTGAQESVEDVLLKFAVTLDGTRKILDDWHASLAAATETINTGNASLVGAIDLAKHELHTTIVAATKSYGLMLDTTKSHLGSIVAGIGTDLSCTLRDSLTNGLSDFGAQTAANLTQVREATTGLVATIKRTNTGLGNSITDLTETVNATSRDLTSATSTLENAVATISGSVTQVTGTLDAFGESIRQATTGVAEKMAGFADVIKDEIKLGLDHIEVKPSVPLVVDESALVNSMAPLHGAMSGIGNSVRDIRATMDARIPNGVPAAAELARLVEKAVTDSVVANLNGRLEAISRDVRDIQTKVNTKKSGWFTWSRR
jgi:hypothetical protein